MFQELERLMNQQDWQRSFGRCIELTWIQELDLQSSLLPLSLSLHGSNSNRQAAVGGEGGGGANRKNQHQQRGG
jgi:hypothetical protein